MAYKITHIHDKTSQNLPPVSTTDEGKVLAVENGKWAVKESGGGGSEPVYIPTKVSEFENDAKYQTLNEVETAINKKIETISNLIPEEASASNKLATMADVGNEYTAGNGIEISENNEISVNENEVALKNDMEIIRSGVWTIWKNNNTKTIFAIASDTLFSKIDISSGSLYRSDWHELLYPEEIATMPLAKLTTMYVDADVSTYYPEDAIFATDVGEYIISNERRLKFRITSGARSGYDEIYVVQALIICRFSE